MKAWAEEEAKARAALPPRVFWQQIAEETGYEVGQLRKYFSNEYQEQCKKLLEESRATQPVRAATSHVASWKKCQSQDTGRRKRKADGGKVMTNTDHFAELSARAGRWCRKMVAAGQDVGANEMYDEFVVCLEEELWELANKPALRDRRRTRRTAQGRLRLGLLPPSSCTTALPCL